MSKHTPGPWEVIVPADGIWPPRVFAGSKFIVMVNNSDDEQSQLIADARLIAAAPDLLEALQYIEGLAMADDFRDMSTILSMARYAIAKATGETK